MTREEALNTWLPIIKVGVETMPECKDALEMAIKALEQECVEPTQKHVENALDVRCDDAISRQAVLDEIDHTNRRGGFGCKLSYTRCRGHIEQLPSVNPSEEISREEIAALLARESEEQA